MAEQEVTNAATKELLDLVEDFLKDRDHKAQTTQEQQDLRNKALSVLARYGRKIETLLEHAMAEIAWETREKKRVMFEEMEKARSKG